MSQPPESQSLAEANRSGDVLRTLQGRGCSYLGGVPKWLHESACRTAVLSGVVAEVQKVSRSASSHEKALEDFKSSGGLCCRPPPFNLSWSPVMPLTCLCPDPPRSASLDWRTRPCSFASACGFSSWVWSPREAQLSLAPTQQTRSPFPRWSNSTATFGPSCRTTASPATAPTRPAQGRPSPRLEESPGRPRRSTRPRRQTGRERTISANLGGRREAAPCRRRSPASRLTARRSRWFAAGSSRGRMAETLVAARARVPQLPRSDMAAWARNPIDQLRASRRLKKESLHRRPPRPTGDADPPAVLRPDRPAAAPERGRRVRHRIPPPEAYEKLVDRLLPSPHYGERMALYWLDLVRYADTVGYHSDNHRDVSPYRDYVIDAFNDNMPLRPVHRRAARRRPAAGRRRSSRRSPRATTGCCMTTEEGGAQAKEYLAKYAADRVRNVSTRLAGR